jgi:hypothetical protein
VVPLLALLLARAERLAESGRISNVAKSRDAGQHHAKKEYVKERKRVAFADENIPFQ